MDNQDKALAEQFIGALQKVVSDADTTGYPAIAHLASVALLAAEEAAGLLPGAETHPAI